MPGARRKDRRRSARRHAAAPPIDHRALCEHVEQDYVLYAQAFIPDDLHWEAAVSDTFDILWLSWNDALAGPNTRRFAWAVLRNTVMARTPHIDGRPCFSQTAFDTVALTYLTEDEARARQLSETMALFQVMSRLPATQLDVIALRILWRMPTERVSELLGLSPAMVRSSQRHGEHFLRSILAHQPGRHPAPPGSRPPSAPAACRARTTPWRRTLGAP